jgi:hypothetical protein
MDCQFEDGHCDGNICQRKNKEDQNVSSFTGDFTRIASLTLTYLTYRIRRDFLAFLSFIFRNKKFRALEKEPKSPTFM